MSNRKLDQIANQLRQSGKYRIIDKHQQPKGYNAASPNDKKLIGVFLDIRAWGAMEQPTDLRSFCCS